MITLTFDDLCEEWAPEAVSWLDRPDAATENHWTIAGRWQRDGLVILRGFMPDYLVTAYETAWRADNDVPGREMGWPYDVPYMNVPELREMCTYKPLANILEFLIGEPMGVHLNLTGWRSTARDWHADSVLNPPHVGSYYCAVWFALDRIDPMAGPFQYVPGSHRQFPPISQEKIRAALGADGVGPDWPKHSERILTPLFEQAIADSPVPPRDFLAERGDVLVWHSRLLHRGSVPIIPTLERRALISHYSGIHTRKDFPRPALQHKDGGWFWPIDQGRHR